MKALKNKQTGEIILFFKGDTFPITVNPDKHEVVEMILCPTCKGGWVEKEA